MRVLLLVSAFNGLSQRVWCALREAGHEVGVLLATCGEQDMVKGVCDARPELVLCPFLKHRVPAEIWRHWRTVIIHPGPVGDRGPSSLDWAIAQGAPLWGVTALQAIEEMDAGPIWAHRTFAMPAEPVRKSALYNGPVADAALECAHEVIAKAADPLFVPTPLSRARVDVDGARPRPAMRQQDRAFDWAQSTESIVRAIRAADGAPGVRTELAGLPVYAYDAHPGDGPPADPYGPAADDPAYPADVRQGCPGELLGRRSGAVLVGTGDGGVWLGHLRLAGTAGGNSGGNSSANFGGRSARNSGGNVPRPPRHSDLARPSGGPIQDGIGSAVKLPATTVLGARLRGVPRMSARAGEETAGSTYRQISYRRTDDVGWLTFDFYNGAMSTRQCRRLLAALRHAVGQDTRTLVLTGGTEAFSNGIHLNAIEAAADPRDAAWANIRAINQVCREVVLCARQVVIAAYSGSAGAGGVMLGLGADVVAARDGIVLNPYYDMGLYGSELHTFTLPRRVGPEVAERLRDDRLPVSPATAARLGLVDEVGPRHPAAFTQWLTDLAHRLAGQRQSRRITAHKARLLAIERPRLSSYEARELGEMSRDIFDDRSGFAAARHAFTHKIAPVSTPRRLTFAAAAPVPALERAPVPAPASEPADPGTASPLTETRPPAAGVPRTVQRVTTPRRKEGLQVSAAARQTSEHAYGSRR